MIAATILVTIPITPLALAAPLVLLELAVATLPTTPLPMSPMALILLLALTLRALDLLDTPLELALLASKVTQVVLTKATLDVTLVLVPVLLV